MIFQLLKTPFPKPERSRKKLVWILMIGLGCSAFIFLYNPFGIANQIGTLLIVDFVIFSLGLIFSLSIIFMEWIVPRFIPKFFMNWSIGKALFWYTLVILFAGVVIFFYKSFFGGFNEFTLTDFFLVLMRIVIISFTVVLFSIGVTQLVNRKRISTLISGENFQISAADGKTTTISLRDILYVTSDDNYVDIHYNLDGNRTKQILRSSLKNIEDQIINPISPIVRCHRQFLINVNQFEIEKASSRNITVVLKNHQDKIPVSAKYVSIIKNKCSLAPKS